MELTNELTKDSFKLFYLDRTGEIHEDRDSSVSGSLARIVLSILGLRDYNITHVLPKMEVLGAEDQSYLTSKCAKRFGISNEQLAAIQKISTFYLSDTSLSTADQKDIKLFLNNSIGDLKLNAALNRLIQANLVLHNVDRKALLLLRSFTFEAMKAEKLTPAFQKARVLGKRLQEERETVQRTGKLSSPLENRLSLEEARELESVIQIAPGFRDFQRMGLKFQRDSRLGILRKNILMADQVMRQTANLLDRGKRPGEISVIFYDLTNFKTALPSFVYQYTAFIFHRIIGTDIAHASMSFNDSREREVESHILIDQTKGRRFLYSRSFKTFNLQLDSIFDGYPQATQQRLQEIYGPEWKSVLKKRFGEIIIHLFNEKDELAALKNPPLRRILGGLGINIHFSKGKEKEFDASNRTICTEYVMKILMQCQHKLQEEIDERGGPDLPPLFTSAEAVSNLLPSRMVRNLLEQERVQEDTQPELLGQIMDYHSYSVSEQI